jgi:CDGSH-type Zn-finger protein
MDKPRIAGKTPLAVELEAGKTYAWCSCGHSSNQPWCDGKHAGSDFRPIVFKAEKDTTGWMCNCKHSSTPQFCDGSHKRL